MDRDWIEGLEQLELSPKLNPRSRVIERDSPRVGYHSKTDNDLLSAEIL
jgi:hypothetical protein